MSTTKRSNFAAGLRTTILLATLTGLFVVIGFAIGGPQTALLFLGFGAIFNLGAYWFSDKIALKMSGAKPISEQEAPRLYQMVRELTTRAGPADAVAAPDPAGAAERLRDRPQPRPARRWPSPQGILKLLSEDELRGVIAHELAHIRNRDVLIQSVAATIAGAITYLGYMLLWFGGDDESPLGLIGSLAMVLLAPIAATIIQLADLAPARVLGRRHGRRHLRQPGVAGERAAAPRGGREGDADARQPGGGAALHREADPRWLRRPLLDAPADRGARPPAAPDAADHRVRPGRATGGRSRNANQRQKAKRSGPVPPPPA